MGQTLILNYVDQLYEDFSFCLTPQKTDPPQAGSPRLFGLTQLVWIGRERRFCWESAVWPKDVQYSRFHLKEAQKETPPQMRKF